MKAGDMVMQSEFIAHWARDKALAFLGDGDSVGVCVAYLKARGIVSYGPSRIKVFDFDERIVGAIKRFADAEQLEGLEAELYNCVDALPREERFDSFYTNPPWGASNRGNSVNVFVQRGMELVGFNGEGVIVVADDDALDWTREVLTNIQSFALGNGFYVTRLMPRLHSYHLDDNPDLRSCNLIVRSQPGAARDFRSHPITDPDRLANFYGDGIEPSVRYVRERKRVDYGTAHDDEYELEFFGGDG
jgi:predicted methyltransferase